MWLLTYLWVASIMFAFLLGVRAEQGKRPDDDFWQTHWSVDVLHFAVASLLWPLSVPTMMVVLAAMWWLMHPKGAR